MAEPSSPPSQPTDFRHQLNALTFVATTNEGGEDVRHLDLNLDVGQLLHTLNMEDEDAAWMPPFIGPYVQRVKCDSWTRPVHFFPFLLSVDGSMRAPSSVNDASAFMAAVESLGMSRAAALIVASVASGGCICLDDPDLATLKHVLTPGTSMSPDEAFQHKISEFEDFKVTWSDQPMLVVVKNRDHLLTTTDKGCLIVGCKNKHGHRAHTAHIPLPGIDREEDATEIRLHLSVKETIELYAMLTDALTLAAVMSGNTTDMHFLAALGSVVSQYLFSVAMKFDEEMSLGCSPIDYAALCEPKFRTDAVLRREMSARSLRLSSKSKMYLFMDPVSFEPRFKDVTFAFINDEVMLVSSDERYEGVDVAPPPLPPPTFKSGNERIVVTDVFCAGRLRRAYDREHRTSSHASEGHDPSSLTESRIACNECVTSTNFQVPPFFTKVTNESFYPSEARGFCLPTWLFIARWPWFRSLLQSGLDESKTRIVNLDFSYDQMHLLDITFRTNSPFRLKEEIDEAFFESCWQDFGAIKLAQTSLITFVRKQPKPLPNPATTTSAPPSTVPFGQFAAAPRYIPVPNPNNAPFGAYGGNAVPPVVAAAPQLNANLNLDPNALIGAWRAQTPIQWGWREIGLEVAHIVLPRLFKLAVIGGVSYGVLLWHFAFSQHHAR